MVQFQYIQISHIMSCMNRFFTYCIFSVKFSSDSTLIYRKTLWLITFSMCEVYVKLVFSYKKSFVGKLNQREIYGK